MKRSIARKWAAALESGDYKQTTGQLRKNGSFCCLGVLCNLHAQEHPEIAKKQKKATEYLGAEIDLPLEVETWAGMYTCDGGFSGFKLNDVVGANSLVDLNDTYQWNFKKIAKVIRKHWKEL